MLEEAQNMNRLIERLLLLARVESDGLPVNIQRLALTGALADLRESLLPLAEEKHQTIELHCAPGLGVLADADLLRHIVLNLGQNAIRHGPPGSAIRWQAQVDGSGAEVWIEVQDEGPGVPPAHRERVFERFNRVDPARARADGGMGLGLCITKAAAERLKGTVELRDTPGPGACFRVRLPAASP
jgi:signal transduction histidine kinase